MSTELLTGIQKQFYKDVSSSKTAIAKVFNVKEEAAISSKLLPEDASLYRALSRARRISEFLLPEASVLQPADIKGLLPELEKAFELVYMDGIFDEVFLNHVIRCLKTLLVKPTIIRMINTQKAPVANAHVQRILLRSTGEKKMSDLVVQRALLSAYLTPLRQNVGSCFATAPCILIQAEQPENFFNDLTTLISTGKLSRVYEGQEFVVPMSLSGGVGITRKRFPAVLHKPLLEYLDQIPFYTDMTPRTLDEHLKKCKAGLHVSEQLVDLTDHSLLKAWEFTIASFSDFKIEIFKWNLYASLGFDQKEVGGIGHMLYHYLDVRLQESNSELEDVQKEYEHAYMRVKMTEGLLRNADNEQKARRLQAEHASNVDHFYACQEKRDELHNSAEQYSQLFSFLLRTYSSMIPNYFQELYDADMIEVNETLFEDSPAGFRLLFKHGRSDPSAWTFIYTEKLFADSLESFFRMTEREVIEACEWEKGKKEIEAITTKLIYFVRTSEFIKSSYNRIKKFHAQHGIEAGQFKTPWSYVSGGTLPQLLQCYYLQPKDFTTEGATVHTPMELLTMYLDLFKGLPPRVTSRSERSRMLATSPNHVFTILPSIEGFVKAWDTRHFTYTWIRDSLLIPGQKFYRGLSIDREVLHLLWLYIGGNEPRSAFQSSIPIEDAPSYFGAPKQRVDAALRAFFPLVPRSLLPKGFKWSFDFAPFSLASQVIGRESLAKQGYTQPQALVFADTNWSTYYFSFLVNPSTHELELWRTDQHGITGQPMAEWNGLFKDPQRPWLVFWDTKEYAETSKFSISENLKRV